MDKRQYPRVQVANMMVDISDRVGFCSGVVKDVSRFGICITDIPRKLHPKNDCVEAVIFSQGQKFKLKLRQRWLKKSGVNMEVGARIDNVPWAWTEMAMGGEPDSGDIWGTMD